MDTLAMLEELLEQLQELFIDTEANDHNQRNIFKEAVVESRKTHFTGAQELKDKIHFDSPLFFDIDEVLAFAKNKNEEMVQGAKGLKQGSLFGQLSNFVNRLENKLGDKRMEFLLGNDSKDTTLEDTLKQLLGYFETGSNVTVLDLSGIPFDVLSITVSLISLVLCQDYVKRLLPDTLGGLVDKMPSLRAGECLLIGDAVVLPSIVQSDKCDPSPASSDIPYFQLWKEKWVHFDVEAVKTLWEK